MRLGEPVRELPRLTPVRGAAAVVQQARRAEDERPVAHAEQRRLGLLDGLEQLLRVGLPDPRRREGDQIGFQQRVEPVLRRDADAPNARRHRLVGELATHAEVDQGYALLGPVDAEHLAEQAELERRDAVDERNRHRSQHGRILSRSVRSATVGGILLAANFRHDSYGDRPRSGSSLRLARPAPRPHLRSGRLNRRQRPRPRARPRRPAIPHLTM